jgi:hypothetical protein
MIALAMKPSSALTMSATTAARASFNGGITQLHRRGDTTVR